MLETTFVIIAGTSLFLIALGFLKEETLLLVAGGILFAISGVLVGITGVETVTGTPCLLSSNATTTDNTTITTYVHSNCTLETTATDGAYNSALAAIIALVGLGIAVGSLANEKPEEEVI